MKLYATTTSERASKGQGGNEYLFINLRDYRDVSYGFIAVSKDERYAYPTIRIFSHGGILQIPSEEMQRIQNDTELKLKQKQKGKSQKGETCEKHGKEYIERHKLDGHYICRACVIDNL